MRNEHTNMTPEAQRIAIAEFCGWRFSGDFVTRWYTKEFNRFPDYLNDLNLIHEAAVRLPYELRNDHVMELRRIVVRDATENMKDLDHGEIKDIYFYYATAAQRAEALLRTIGKWKD